MKIDPSSALLPIVWTDTGNAFDVVPECLGCSTENCFVGTTSDTWRVVRWTTTMTRLTLRLRASKPCVARSYVTSGSYSASNNTFSFEDTW